MEKMSRREICDRYRQKGNNLWKENHTPKAIERRKRYKKSLKGKLAIQRYDKKRDKNKQRFFTKRWIKNNPEKVAEYKRARRKRLQSVFRNLTPDDWKTIIEQFDYRCVYCNKTGKLTLDHIIPISRGGDHTKDNVAPACVHCNSSKGNKMIDEWTNGNK